MTIDVELINVRKDYGSSIALHETSLRFQKGEFVTLLGPSGCGKTTTLNIIAGFAPATSGQVLIRGVDVTQTPPNKRNLGMMFQNYALFPHMTVFENVAFGLRMKKVDAAQIRSRVGETLELVHLEHLSGRYPRQLSGGQQQRVALARAIAPRPSVLLLDEPLSNLDLKLREAMRREIKNLQREIGVTSIFVTHDQDEALTMSDRIVVMREGRVEQIGSPDEIYTAPASRFVGSFVGQMNFFDVKVKQRQGDTMRLALDGGTAELMALGRHDATPGDRFVAGIRPEEISILPAEGIAGPDVSVLAGNAAEIVASGPLTSVYVRVDGNATFRMDSMSSMLPPGIAVGLPVRIAIPKKKIFVFDPDSGAR